MSRRATWAIVPVKALSHAKRRLAPVLPADARCELMLTMLADLLGVLNGVDLLEGILVVTADAQVAQLARCHGASVLREDQSLGLNEAVSAGLAHVDRRAAQALVLPADVPFATADEISTIIGAGGHGHGKSVAIVPSADGGGTNALLLAPPSALAPRFGPGSFVEHLSQAVARRVDVKVLHLAGLAADIDGPADVLKLLADPRTATRYAFLQSRISTGHDWRATGAEKQ